MSLTPSCSGTICSNVSCAAQSSRRLYCTRLKSCHIPFTCIPSPYNVGWPCRYLIASCTSSAPISDAATLVVRSEEHTSELQSQFHLVCRLLLEKKKKNNRK